MTRAAATWTNRLFLSFYDGITSLKSSNDEIQFRKKKSKQRERNEIDDDFRKAIYADKDFEKSYT